MILSWEAYGLKQNPYDTTPLVEGGVLPIEEVFIGRDSEGSAINNLLSNENRLAIAISGNVGVGKTTLVNYHKYIWKHIRKQKRLFSFRREIELHSEILNKRQFLLEVIGSIVKEIQLLDPELIESSPLIKKLNRLVDITETVSISGGLSLAGFGGEFSKQTSHELPYNITDTKVEEYFLDLVKFITTTPIAKNTYSGLIVHVNNIDVAMAEDEKSVMTFFAKMRDILQTPSVYYFFIGPVDFYQAIIRPQPRVSGAFYSAPLTIKPLSKTQVVKALQTRVDALKSSSTSLIKPVDEQVIYELYDLYRGDIRQIMGGLKNILYQNAKRIPQTLSKTIALGLLLQHTWNEIDRLGVTKTNKTILRYMGKQQKPVTQSEVSQALNIATSNLSGNYFKTLQDNSIIALHHIEGNKKFWYFSNAYKGLVYEQVLKKALQAEYSKQLSLFASK